MKLKSKYEINDTFRITGKGILFAGNIKEGLVSIGDYLVFQVENRELRKKIIGIEGIRSERENNCGLLIETNNEQEIEMLRSWEPNGIIGRIYEPDLI